LSLELGLSRACSQGGCDQNRAASTRSSATRERRGAWFREPSRLGRDSGTDRCGHGGNAESEKTSIDPRWRDDLHRAHENRSSLGPDLQRSRLSTTACWTLAHRTQGRIQDEPAQLIRRPKASHSLQSVNLYLSLLGIP